MKPPVWDVHAHFSGVTGKTPEERADQLLAFADRLGVDRLCLHMGMVWSQDPSPEDLERQNNDVLRALKHRPERLFGFVYLNPKHLEKSLSELESCVADGPMIGVKLWVAQRCTAPELDPIVRRATELKAVVLQHAYLKSTGNLPGESTPDDLAALARRHPEATIICGHTGAEWETGIRTLRACPNVYADLCGSDPTAGMAEMAVRELGAERVLYGSDCGGRSFASQLAKVTGADISLAARRLILGENLRRLLTPILQKKGMKF